MGFGVDLGNIFCILILSNFEELESAYYC